MPLKKKSRKKKFVVWLENRVDKRDDEWVAVWARSAKEADCAEVRFDRNRFIRGRIYTAAEFRKMMGISA